MWAHKEGVHGTFGWSRSRARTWWCCTSRGAPHWCCIPRARATCCSPRLPRNRIAAPDARVTTKVRSGSRRACSGRASIRTRPNAAGRAARKAASGYRRSRSSPASAPTSPRTSRPRKSYGVSTRKSIRGCSGYPSTRCQSSRGRARPRAQSLPRRTANRCSFCCTARCRRRAEASANCGSSIRSSCDRCSSTTGTVSMASSTRRSA